MYMPLVDPHLTHGCEVSLDVDLDHLKPLEDVQAELIRRMLGVNKHSSLSNRVLMFEAECKHLSHDGLRRLLFVVLQPCPRFLAYRLVIVAAYWGAFSLCRRPLVSAGIFD
jgi:hypothetical protein